MTNIAITHNYNHLPYPNLSYQQTHPNKMATTATLLGMKPTPINNCRVLEIGCGQGGNLLPMAYHLPQSKFTGIDFSTEQIDTGQHIINELNLQNITLKTLDLLEINADFGQFDYIIAHSVYSWVSENVQTKLLQICKHNLAPNGVVYINYNTYPGWHTLKAMREMMLYHVQHITDPKQRADEARELIAFLHQAVGENSVYGLHLKEYSNHLKNKHYYDSFFLHDELEKENHPFYFYQFVAQAKQHGLQYLSGSSSSESALPHHLAQVNAFVKQKAFVKQEEQNTIELEQYLDFLANPTHRYAFLCHNHINLQQTINPNLIANFHVISSANSITPYAIAADKNKEQFEGDSGDIITTTQPIIKTALEHLEKIWPQSIPFTTLLTTVRTKLQKETAFKLASETDDTTMLATTLLQIYLQNKKLVEFYYHPPANFVPTVSKKPVASLLACVQAKYSRFVTNQRHNPIELDPFQHYLLPLLDGSRDHPTLVHDLLTGPVATGELPLIEAEKLLTDKKEQQTYTTNRLPETLQWLAESLLLIN